MTPAARRQVIEVLTTEHQLSVRRACRVAGLARAAWYATPINPAVRDAAVIDVLQGLVADHVRWGFWKCYDRMRLDGHPWNHKRVHPAGRMTRSAGSRRSPICRAFHQRRSPTIDGPLDGERTRGTPCMLS